MSDLPAIKYLDKAARDAGYDDWGALVSRSVENSTVRYSVIAHARTLEEADRLREALAKYGPEPVDEDRAAFFRIFGKLHAGETATYISANVEEALAQYKAERPTITDDEALLIAREICAMVDPASAVEYRAGTWDRTPCVQFALAMVKRDPAALEAFRGVGRG